VTRQRAFVVVQSAPRYCPICRGSKRVQIVRLADMRGTGVVQCPHCNEHLPVIHLPLREDKRSTA
jgi:hypothetical protein